MLLLGWALLLCGMVLTASRWTYPRWALVWLPLLVGWPWLLLRVGLLR